MDSFNIESVKINRRKSTGGRYITDFIFYFTNQTSMELSCYNEEKHIDVRLGDPND